jgi:transposase
VKLRLQRWQCRNEACERKTFTAQLPGVAAPRARRTERAIEILYLLGHGVGGRPGERLIKRIGMPTSDDTILRCLKRRAKAHSSEETARVVGVDDWAWRKGSTYGTIIVDLERREVLDLFPERAAGMTADWLKRHPGVEIISRDRCGSFAQGAQEGAPQAQQISDRFHIVQNLREAVQAQLGRAAGFSARPLRPAEGEEVANVRDSSRVYILRDARPMLILVYLGRDDGEYVEVVSGELHLGDELIIGEGDDASTYSTEQRAFPSPRAE